MAQKKVTVAILIESSLIKAPSNVFEEKLCIHSCITYNDWLGVKTKTTNNYLFSISGLLPSLLEHVSVIKVDVRSNFGVILFTQLQIIYTCTDIQ